MSQGDDASEAAHKASETFDMYSAEFDVKATASKCCIGLRRLGCPQVHAVQQITPDMQDELLTAIINLWQTKPFIDAGSEGL